MRSLHERGPVLVRAHSVALALFLLLFGWYVLTMSGHTYASDEETVLAAGQSVLSTGSFAISPDEPFLMNTRTGAHGERYSIYGPLQSALAMPFIAAGDEFALLAPGYGPMVMRLVVLLLPALATAATAWLVMLWVVAVGFDWRIGLVVGLLFGLTSLAWPQGRTFFAESLATFFLTLCAYGLRRDTPRWWAIAGVAAAAALATKMQTGLAFPALAIYGLAVCWREGPLSIRAILGRLGWGLLGAALPLTLLLAYNTHYFGSPMQSGYGSVGILASAQKGDWRTGLYGLTISTGKGVLFYSPSLLLGLIGLGLRWRRQWREATLSVLMLVLHLGFYSKVPYWHGDGAWGPRYMVFVLPFVYLPAAGLLAALAERRWRVGRWLVAGLAGLSFVVQLLPLLVNFDTYIQLTDSSARYFVPADSPLLAHPRIWASRVQEYYWKFAGGPPNTAILTKDFSYSEGDRSKGELLPRWTYTDATIQLNPPDTGAIDGEVIVGDHRPWPLPRAQFGLFLNGQPLTGVERIDLDKNQIRWQLRFQIPAELARRGARLELRSDTWNPNRDTQDNPRNEDLGLRLDTLELRQNDQQLQLGEALPVPAPQMSRRGLWLWAQDVPNHHLFDIWVWYVFASGMPRLSAIALLTVLGVPALVMLLAGAFGIRRALRGTTARPIVQTTPGHVASRS